MPLRLIEDVAVGTTGPDLALQLRDLVDASPALDPQGRVELLALARALVSAQPAPHGERGVVAFALASEDDVLAPDGEALAAAYDDLHDHLSAEVPHGEVLEWSLSLVMAPARPAEGR